MTLRRCDYCGAYRSRLHKCAACGERKCGCCTYKMRDGRRVCTMPPSPVSCMAALLAREGKCATVPS